MLGKITVTDARALKVHTLTAPERGWQVNSHIIELSSQLLVIDSQYLLPCAREVVLYAAQLQKPITRLYISHYHPDHLLGAVVFSAPVYALSEVSAKIAAVGERVAREEHEKFGDDVPTRVAMPTCIVKPGVETIDAVPVNFIHLDHAETRDALMVGLPEQAILITQDLVYNRVHAMVGEKAFESWTATLEKAQNGRYNKVLPGHGAPGGKERYSLMQHYLSTAREVYAVAANGEDMKDKMIQAFPGYGGIGMLDQQKRFLFPGAQV
jgi:glyoxylase-like metal-dependent hydrolase (beta-lactamase superfamily II)